MLMQNAKRHFGSCADIARVLDGLCEPSAVYQWQKKGVVPLWAAEILADASHGAVPIDKTLYVKGRRMSVGKKRLHAV